MRCARRAPCPASTPRSRSHLVEASPTLRARQRAVLEGYRVAWHDTVEGLPDAPLFLIANEFFDALPIRQFVRDGPGWRERMVGLTDGALAFGLSAPLAPPALAHRLADTGPGEMVETRPAALPVIAGLGARIAAHGGAALVVDYGGWRSRGDTLQALRAHEFDDPLAHPGEADLTAHVDFEALAAAASGLSPSALTPQGIWLERLGITARAQALAGRLTGAALDSSRRRTSPLDPPDGNGNAVQDARACPPGGSPASRA